MAEQGDRTQKLTDGEDVAAAIAAPDEGAIRARAWELSLRDDAGSPEESSAAGNRRTARRGRAGGRVVAPVSPRSSAAS